MRAYRVLAHGSPLEPQDLPTPVPVGTEVLVKVRRCGVCHTDLHLWDGYYDFGSGNRLQMADRGIRPPFTPGHEIAGEIVAAGPDAQIDTSRAVIVYPWIGCDRCATCADRNGHLCTQARSIGIFSPGGYGDHVLVPHPRYLADADGIDKLTAPTLACSGLTVYSALRKLLPAAGNQPLLIVGAGGLGLMAIQVAKAVRAPPIIAIDVAADKRAAAMQLGAKAAIDPNAPDAKANIADLTGSGAAATLDLVGSARSLQLSMDVAKRGGTIVVVGLFGGAVSVPVPMLPLRALSLIGSYVGSLKEFNELSAYARNGRIAPIPAEVRHAHAVNTALSDLRAGRVAGRVILEHGPVPRERAS
jgi:D-arabinose 1-dehydrogenase-like Zn-dependent alcohol dehydrogenase